MSQSAGTLLLLSLCLLACGSPRTQVVPGDDLASPSASDAAAGGQQSSAADPCAGWPDDLAARNRADIDRLGLYLSHSVAQGQLGPATQHEEQDRWFAPFEITTIWHGAQFLEGLTVWVELGANEVAHFALPGEYIVGFGGNTYPINSLASEGLQEALWWQKKVVIAASERGLHDELIGYGAHQTPHVAVVKIVGQDEDRTRFQVLETLAGELPASFSVNWSARTFPVPFPPVSSTAYLASLSHLSYSEAAGLHLATIGDLRLHTPTSRALVEQKLAHPAELIDIAPQALIDEYRTSWTFKRAPAVLATSVTGAAEECCTAMGGRYIAHEIVEQLQGASKRTALVTGGHGYYGDESCGDAYLLAAFDLDSSGEPTDGFTCDRSGMIVAPGPAAYPLSSSRTVQLRGTTQARRQLDAWLAAAPPVFRLYPTDKEITADHLSPAGTGDAPWSNKRMAAERVIAVGTHPVLLTVERVEQRDQPAPRWHEVTLSTPFYLRSYEQSEDHRAKLAFRCGDPRLLQPGAQWLAMMLFDGHASVRELGAEAYQSAFLIPGLLLPNLQYIRRVLEELPHAMSRARQP